MSDFINAHAVEFILLLSYVFGVFFSWVRPLAGHPAPWEPFVVGLAFPAAASVAVGIVLLLWRFVAMMAGVA